MIKYLVFSTCIPLLISACPFCDPEVIRKQAFYEDELVLALVTHKPILPGHSLIIPKRHVERFEELTDEELVHMKGAIEKTHRAAVKLFHVEAYLLHQKNGVEVGQSVPHVHIHYLPRQKGDSSFIKLFYYILKAQLKKPLSEAEMKHTISQYKKEASGSSTRLFSL